MKQLQFETYKKILYKLVNNVSYYVTLFEYKYLKMKL